MLSTSFSLRPPLAPRTALPRGDGHGRGLPPGGVRDERVGAAGLGPAALGTGRARSPAAVRSFQEPAPRRGGGSGAGWGNREPGRAESRQNEPNRAG